MPDDNGQLAELLRKFSVCLEYGPSLEGTLHIDVTDLGHIFISPDGVREGSADADCRVSMGFADFMNVYTGQVQPITAWMAGRAILEGDPTIVMQFAGKVRAAEEVGAISRPADGGSVVPDAGPNG